MKNPWLTGTIGLLLAAFLTFHALQQKQLAAIDATHLRLSKAIDDVELDLTRSLAGMKQMFLGFQHYLELMEQQPEPDYSGLRRVMDTLVLGDDYLISLVVAASDGQILHWTNSGPKPNISQREYFVSHTTHIIDGINLSNPLPSIMSPGQWIFGASQAIRHPDGSLNKVLIGIIDARRLFRRLEEMRGDNRMVLTVLSSSGMIYARSPDHDQLVGKQRPELLEGLRPTLERQNTADMVVMAGNRQLQLLRQIECCRLVIRAEAAAISPRQNGMLLLLATGAGIVLILLWQLVRLLRLRRREQELKQQLRMEQQRDPLTGLPLWSVGPEKDMSGATLDPPVAMIMVGLDLYPQLVMEHGEQAGNQLVARSAGIVAQFATGSTRLSRYFCSRFILLLPGVDQEQALATAEQIRTALAAEVFVYQQTQLRITASLGVTRWEVDEADLGATVRRAATALATAGKQGGNQVCRLTARETWLERKSS